LTANTLSPAPAITPIEKGEKTNAPDAGSEYG
jgi:hypothetical protein